MPRMFAGDPKQIIMERKNKNGEYDSPIVSVIDIEMQDVIAASNGVTYTIGDYSSGYSEEEDF